MGEKLEYNIANLTKEVQEMKRQNSINKRNQQTFFDYIDTKLSKEWNTAHGQEVVRELREFVEKDFQEYISYLDRKISIFEDSIIPALNEIHNA